MQFYRYEELTDSLYIVQLYIVYVVALFNILTVHILSSYLDIDAVIYQPALAWYFEATAALR